MPIYQYPNLSDIFKTEASYVPMSEEELDKIQDVITRVLVNHKISGKIVSRFCGIVNTNFKVELTNCGISKSKVSRLSDDLEMFLKASNITITFPSDDVGFNICIPNAVRQTYNLGALLDSDAFKGKAFYSSRKIALPIGLDEENKPVIVHLDDLPHLLIAGSTGSGKSVCINNLVSSILAQTVPGTVQMILIDPKKVELGIYEKSETSLLIPPVTDNWDVYPVLEKVIREMLARYNMLKQAGCRDINEYNAKNATQLARLVVIVDELADLYATCKTEVEPQLIRIAQLGRAAGIHLILATQYPSCKVVSSELKVNIPARVCFSLSSKINSKTILDTHGAEKLLGKGDGLFCDGRSSILKRFQSPMVTSEEIEKLINYLNSHKLF